MKYRQYTLKKKSAILNVVPIFTKQIQNFYQYTYINLSIVCILRNVTFEKKYTKIFIYKKVSKSIFFKMARLKVIVKENGSAKIM